MTSLFKKTVLSVAMLGCVFGAQAKEKNTKASTLQTAATTGAIAIGASLVTGSAMYLDNNRPSSLSLIPFNIHQLTPTGLYGYVLLPGIALATVGTLYLFNQAKGGFNKIRSTLGSALTGAGAFVLTCGLGIAMNSTTEKPLPETIGPMALAGFGLIAGGYLLQPKNATEEVE